ncbi:MAG TPA: hypothetical protein VIT41_10735 [Microlunatus sp.]
MTGGSRSRSDTVRRRVRGTGGVICVLLLVAGCGRPIDVEGTAAGSSVSPSGTAPASAEPSMAEDAAFTFDDIASYQGDAEIEITGAGARMITAGMTGAESTQGQMVVVSVLIRNLSAEELDATTVLVTAASGPDDIEAPLIADPAGDLSHGFLGVITPGAEDTADYGFAIPFTALNQVRVTVDLGDGVHEPVSFADAVVRDQ